MDQLMEQLERVHKTDGTTIICPLLMMDFAKTPQAFAEGRPKRQRPTHQGEFWFRFRETLIWQWLFLRVRPGGMRKSMERSGTKTKDPVQLEKRLGLFSGVALIAGTMIGNAKQIHTRFNSHASWTNWNLLKIAWKALPNEAFTEAFSLFRARTIKW